MSALVVSPTEVKALSQRPLLLIDVREEDEWRREHISDAQNMPLGHIAPGCFSEKGLRPSDIVIFHCQSGMRTKKAREQLLAAALPAKALIMQGGIAAWKAAGYPVVRDRRQPLPLMRQVHIAAGTLALGGTLAGALLSPAFYVIPGVVGAGLLVAGVTGWCGMALLLSAMPWNKAQG